MVPRLPETRTVTLTLYGKRGTDFEAILSRLEDTLNEIDSTGMKLDWNIEREG